MSRSNVLTHGARETAQYLQDHPREWFLVATGDRDRAAVIKQTAWRIRKGTLQAFPRSGEGHYEAATTAARNREDAVAEVEMVARWVPAGQ